MLVIALHAVSIPPKRVVNSESSGLSIATSDMKRVKVTPVVSHTSSNTGALVLVSIGVSTAELSAEDLVKAFPGAKAAAEDADKRIANAVNFILGVQLMRSNLLVKNVRQTVFSLMLRIDMISFDFDSFPSHLQRSIMF